MHDLLPAGLGLRVQQSPRRITRAAVDSLEQLIIVTPAKWPDKSWSQLPDGKHLEALVRRAGVEPERRIWQSRLSNRLATGLTLGRLPEAAEGIDIPGAYPLLRFAGELAAAALQDKPHKLGLTVLGLSADESASLVRAMVLAVAAHRFQLPRYQSGKTTRSRTLTLKVFGLGERVDVGRSLAEAEATNLARWLTAQPPNKLDARTYRDALEQLSADNGWRMRFLDEKQLKRLAAGAFLAVAQGNASADAGIAHIRYRPGKTTASPALALVGKGIIFDTGGTNLKPFRAMLDMHHDMAGSAVAVATLLALTRLKVPFAVDCWLAITENRLSADAYKSRDIVTASNGTTIEVIHTDAEGRMALADTLALAAREQPELILDYATLTGSCVQALTERYSGVFSNRDALNQLLIDVGRESGERVWPFPMDKDFDDDLKSSVADILQCAMDGTGDHIHAARFLQRFVPDNIPWVHMDLSSGSRKSELAQIPSGTTGFGVRFSLSLVLDHGETVKQTANAIKN